MEGGMALIETLGNLMMVLQEVFGGINMCLMKIFNDIKVTNTKCIINYTFMEEHQRFWRKGPWTTEEDRLLIEHVKLHGEGRWNSVARLTGLKRNAKSCRLRWVNYLRPDLKRGRITPHEEKIILDLHAQWGNRWSTIARSLPGRTDNEIKNYWRTHFKKKGKMTLDDSAKLKARLLKRQKFQQEQQNQLQLQKNKEDMEKVMLLIEESNNKVVWMHQDMVHEEMPTVLYPVAFNDSQHVVEINSMYEDFILWDGLWNLEDVPYATTKGCVPMPFF